MADHPSLNALEVIYGRERAIRMMEARAMKRIKAAVASSAAPVLDAHVHLTREVRFAMDALSTGEPRRVFLDVPLRAVVALDHKNFAPDAHTWRSLLDGIHGVGWEQPAIDWMESEIGTSWLPVPEAAEGLRLQAAGAAIRCANGMHRLVAAVCWLAATKQAFPGAADVSLRKVDVRFRDILPEAASLVVEAIGRGACVDVASHDTGGYIRIVDGGSARFFDCDGLSVTPFRPTMSFLERVGHRLRPGNPGAFGRKWQAVTPRLADALRDDGWLRRQLATPRYADTPA